MWHCSTAGCIALILWFGFEREATATNELTDGRPWQRFNQTCMRSTHTPHFTAVCRQIKNELFTHKRTDTHTHTHTSPLSRASWARSSQLIADFYFNLFLDDIIGRLCVRNCACRQCQMTEKNVLSFAVCRRIMMTAKTKLHESYFCWMHTIDGVNKMRKRRNWGQFIAQLIGGYTVRMQRPAQLRSFFFCPFRAGGIVFVIVCAIGM